MVGWTEAVSDVAQLSEWRSRPELHLRSTGRVPINSSKAHCLHATHNRHALIHTHNMAPLTAASDEKTHQALLDKLDINAVHKPFRNTHWKPPQRRNKNLKQVLGEASRKEASMMNTQANSGASTPAVPSEGGATPAGIAHFRTVCAPLAAKYPSYTFCGIVLIVPNISLL